MALDEALLHALPRLQAPVLRFYGWTQAAASFGYFQRYAEVQRLTPLRPLIRRPTAGGIVPHDADWTYSFSIPPQNAWYALRAVESYRLLHEWIRRSLSHLGIKTDLAQNPSSRGHGQCFVGYEQYDLVFMDCKVAGAAQRRSRMGLLIQGSVQIPGHSNRLEWENAMLCCVPTDHTRWIPFIPSDEVISRATELAKRKYSCQDWNEKR